MPIGRRCYGRVLPFERMFEFMFEFVLGFIFEFDAFVFAVGIGVDGGAVGIGVGVAMFTFTRFAFELLALFAGAPPQAMPSAATDKIAESAIVFIKLVNLLSFSKLKVWLLNGETVSKALQIRWIV
jgi:hypothetical protein